MPPVASEKTRALLGRLYAEYHKPAYLDRDPLAFPHRYEDWADREVVALIAASFAFGNVVSIQSALEWILARLGPRPAEILRQREPADWRFQFRGFRYRWVGARDLRVYLAWIGEALRRHGSLGGLWQAVDSDADPTVIPALERWVGALKSMPADPLRPGTRRLRRANGTVSSLPTGADLLLTSPAGKSACKRMNLFLRWVCRPDDGIDLGLWPVDPARLIVPVDTHVMHAARMMQMTDRRIGDLRAAREITAVLRSIDPADPVRFDFSMTRPGILRIRDLLGDGP